MRIDPGDLAAVRDYFREGYRVEGKSHASALRLWRRLDPVNPRWTDKGARQCGWMFRGQADASWPMLPAAWRPAGESARVIEVAKKAYQEAHPERDHSDPWKVQLGAEGLVLKDFIRVAEREGCDLPIDLPSEGSVGPASSHEIVTLAQHHLLPTCLLDFTLDPAVAMFWAVDGEPQTPEADVAVWAVRRWWPERRITCVEAHAHHSRSRNKNLHAQDGVTVAMAMGDQFLRATGRFPALEECKHLPVDHIVKLTLPRSQVPELRRLLEIRGYTRARLTPGFYGVVDTVLARYKP